MVNNLNSLGNVVKNDTLKLTVVFERCYVVPGKSGNVNSEKRNAPVKNLSFILSNGYVIVRILRCEVTDYSLIAACVSTCVTGKSVSNVLTECFIANGEYGSYALLCLVVYDTAGYISFFSATYKPVDTAYNDLCLSNRPITAYAFSRKNIVTIGANELCNSIVATGIGCGCAGISNGNEIRKIGNLYTLLCSVIYECCRRGPSKCGNVEGSGSNGPAEVINLTDQVVILLIAFCKIEGYRCNEVACIAGFVIGVLRNKTCGPGNERYAICYAILVNVGIIAVILPLKLGDVNALRIDSPLILGKIVKTNKSILVLVFILNFNGEDLSNVITCVCSLIAGIGDFNQVKIVDCIIGIAVSKKNLVLLTGVERNTVVFGIVFVNRTDPSKLRYVDYTLDAPGEIFGSGSNNEVRIISSEGYGCGVVAVILSAVFAGNSCNYACGYAYKLNIMNLSVILKEIILKCNGASIQLLRCNGNVNAACVSYTIAGNNVCVNAGILNVLNLKGVGGNVDKIITLVPLIGVFVCSIANNYTDGLGLAVIVLVDISGGICLTVVEYGSKYYVVVRHLGNHVAVTIYPEEKIVNYGSKISNLCACRKESCSDNIAVYLVVDTVDLLNVNGDVCAECQAVFLVVIRNEAEKNVSVSLINLQKLSSLLHNLLNELVSKSVSTLILEVTVGVGNLIVLILVAKNVKHTVIHVLFGNVLNALIYDTNTVVKSNFEVSLVLLNDTLDLLVVKSAEIYVLANDIVSKYALEVYAINKLHKIVKGQSLYKCVYVITVCGKCAEHLRLKRGINKIGICSLKNSLGNDLGNVYFHRDGSVRIVKADMSADDLTDSSDLIVAATYLTGKCEFTGGTESSADRNVKGKLHFIVTHVRDFLKIRNLGKKICKVAGLNLSSLSFFSCTVKNVTVNSNLVYVSCDIDQRNFGVNVSKLVNRFLITCNHLVCIILSKLGISNLVAEHLLDSALSIEGFKSYVIKDTHLMRSNKKAVSIIYKTVNKSSILSSRLKEIVVVIISVDSKMRVQSS